MLSLAVFLLAIAPTLSPSEVNLLDLREAGARSVILKVAIDGGSADDPAGKEGLAALTARLLAGQTRARLEPDGAGLDVWVGKDMIVFSAEGAADQIASVQGALAATLIAPSFDGPDIDALRSVQQEALRALRGSDRDLADEAFDAFIYADQPYGHPVEGGLAALDTITRDDIVAFHQARFRKGAMVAAIGGPSDGNLASLVKRGFEELPDGQPVHVARPPAFFARPRFLVVERPGAQRTLLRIGHPMTVSRAHPDYFAVRLAVAALGEIGDSRGALARELVTARGISREAFASFEPGAPPRAARRGMAFVMTADADPADARIAIEVSLKEMATLARQGVPAGLPELARAFLDRRDPAPSTGMMMALRDLLGRTPGLTGRFESSVLSVTASDIAAAAGRHLHPDRVAIVAVVPDAEAFVRRMVDPEARADAPSFRLGLSSDDFDVVRAAELFR